MSTNWYYVRNEQRFGPFTFEQFQQLAASGLLTPTDMVLDEATQQWLSAQAVPGLFPAASSPARSTSPQPPARKPSAPAKERKPQDSSSGWLGHPVVVLVGLGLGLGVLKFVGCLPEDLRTPFDKNPQARLAKEVTEATSIPVTAYGLDQEYRANEVVADQKYSGKILEVTGTISRIQAGTTGLFGTKPRLHLGNIQCVFPDNGAVSQLVTGQQVTIRGKCTGKRVLEHCLITR